MLLSTTASMEERRSELPAVGASLELQLAQGIPFDGTVVLVLANLCRYAADAGASRVRCTLAQIGGVLHGAVDDDGPGLDQRDIERAFARGFSSKPDAAGTGRGIGLSVVRNAVSERGGEIIVSRSPWGGARFAFEMDAPR